MSSRTLNSDFILKRRDDNMTPKITKKHKYFEKILPYNN